MHSGGLLFTGGAADIGADGVGGEVACGAMEPAGQNRMFRQPRCILRQSDEDGLGYILGRLRIANEPQSCRINEINVPPDQFGEGRFRAILEVIA